MPSQSSPTWASFSPAATWGGCACPIGKVCGLCYCAPTRLSKDRYTCQAELWMRPRQSMLSSARQLTYNPSEAAIPRRQVRPQLKSLPGSFVLVNIQVSHQRLQESSGFCMKSGELHLQGGYNFGVDDPLDRNIGLQSLIGRSTSRPLRWKHVPPRRTGIICYQLLGPQKSKQKESTE